jgi:hypothetical protein
MTDSRLSHKVFRHIFTGPNSATRLSESSIVPRRTNAKIHGMKKVTPASIAYAAVQVSMLLPQITDLISFLVGSLCYLINAKFCRIRWPFFLSTILR